jgi:hypothetical protein
MRIGLYAGLVLFFAFTVISMVRAAIYQHRLYRYLLMNHTETWEELTTIGGIGPGMLNSRRGMKFLLGPEYLNDPEVLRMKVIVRNSFLYVISGMLATFFWMCVIAAVTAHQ